MATLRDLVEDVLKRVPDDALEEARLRLAALLHQADDPLFYALANTPLDDEPLTDEDLAAIAEAEAEIARGDVVTLDELDVHMAARRAKTA